MLFHYCDCFVYYCYLEASMMNVSGVFIYAYVQPIVQSPICLFVQCPEHPIYYDYCEYLNAQASMAFAGVTSIATAAP